MPKTARPRRSVLYMPGSNARALEKAKAITADGLILDLEDAVAPDAKDLARLQVCQAVKAGGSAAVCGADAILLPKVESADAIRHLEAIMRAAGAPDQVAIWAMMETPRSVLESERIAAASPRMECLVMGTSDLAKELDCAHTRERLPMITSLGLCLLAARAYSLSILDGVYLDLNDEAGFDFACRQGAELGFDGKTLIHPKQVDACNRVFTPKPEDVEWSRKIIAAHAAAAARGEGVAVVDGKLIENLHVESAKRLVEMAEAITRMQAAPAAA
ncbi:MAG: CoA ester lyase [Rhodospirillales bacterium]|nr:CoA ester lyase [Rhodospirillales bacterium]